MKQGSILHSLRARGIALAAAFFVVALSPTAAPRADNGEFQVVPGVFDPANTDLVQAAWLSGIGCPTNAGISTTGGKKPDASYTDPACATGDPKDKNVEGLLLAKTGPTGNAAAGGAVLKGLPNFLRLTELGYDIRKPVDFSDPRGSHCGAGAPRFNVTTSNNVLHFVGCASPPPVSQTVGNGWLRLRRNPATAFPPITAAETVTSIQIVFDEGQDTGPDLFGAAILDNIDVNGVLIGHGPDNESH
jgi:hypothetical protein